jgi:four helix bundle protein
MEASKSFFDLFVWKKAHEFVLCVYRVCSKFPDFEQFGLRSQFTRAAVSIPANIAEGYKKLSKADKLRFFNISQGSLEECKYYILLSKDLGYISNESYIELCSLAKETSKLLLLYIQGVQNNDYKNL